MESEAVAVIIGIIFAVNAFLFGLYNALGYIKDKTTKIDLDNKLYDLLGKVLGFLQKVIEVIGPVSTVKTAPAPSESKPT